MKEIHVNLVDLIDSSIREVELFSTLDELRVYTIETGKFFPKESAYAGGVLKFLLREIFKWVIAEVFRHAKITVIVLIANGHVRHDSASDAAIEDRWPALRAAALSNLKFVTFKLFSASEIFFVFENELKNIPFCKQNRCKDEVPLSCPINMGVRQS